MFMHLKVLLPFGVFAEHDDVARIVVETRAGSCGLLPRRLDCVAALVPGILIYQCQAQPEVYVAVDGTDLGQLRAAMAREFLELDAQERGLRSSLAKIESGLISRLVALHRD
jgi:F-type H+-transporting ATPase subunit epsilon